MTAIVLGHDGFIGRHTVRALARVHPACSVTGLSLASFDLADEASVSRLAAHFDRSSAVLFLSGIKKQHGDTIDIFGRNMAIATNVARALLSKPVRRVVFFSSAEVYGETTDDTRITEETPVRPTSYYGVAKLASEGLLRKAAEAVGASLAIVRPPLVYGDGDPSRSYGPSGFAHAIARGEGITLWGDGLERRDFVYVGDVAEVAARLAFGESQGIVNLASGRSETFRDVVDRLASLAGHAVDVQQRPRTRPSVDQGYVVDRLRSLVPEMRFTTLEAGLGRLLEAELAASRVASHGG